MEPLDFVEWSLLCEVLVFSECNPFIIVFCFLLATGFEDSTSAWLQISLPRSRVDRAPTGSGPCFLLLEDEIPLPCLMNT